MPDETPDAASDPEFARILNLGQVDEQALAAIERGGNALDTASAYFAACSWEMAHGRIASARQYLNHGANFAPDSIAFHVLSALVSTVEQNYTDALTHAKRATALAPDARGLLVLLGTCYYNADDLRNAIATWKRALALHDSDKLREQIARTERQIEVEGDYAEQASSHFVLHYEGREIGIALKADLLRTLEDCYAELTRELAFTPSADIAVVLYSEKTFFDVTQAPSWAGALYDGKLRIPTAGVKEVTPRMRQVLKHELTHSFIHAITHGRCPAWLNEGVAQLLEPRSSAPFRARFAPLLRDGKYATLQQLEQPFAQLTSDQAEFAYAESLLAVEYVRAQYGDAALRHILELLGTGEGGEQAVSTATHHSYHDIEERLAQFAAAPVTANGD